MDAPLRFLADAMLGTLARWLRILGYDTAYDAGLDDDGVVRLARGEGRIILSRDTGFLPRKGVQVLYVTSEILEQQIAQLLGAFRLPVDHPFSRCPVCNGVLKAVCKEEARGQVPTYVLQTQPEFHLCPSCQRFYWRGTHWQGMWNRVSSLGGSE